MLKLDPNDPVKGHLESLRLSIAEGARICIATFFGKECTIGTDWATVERLRGDFHHNVCLGCGNNDYQALAAFGTGNAEVEEFLGGAADGNDILDAFGELLNTYFGMLMDDASFTGFFGILTQSIPQYSAEVNFFPRAWGCNGSLLTPGGGVMYIGFAIKKNRSSFL